MIDFNLYASPNFRGGNYYTTFSANDVADLKGWLKHYWYKTGFSSAAGEIFIFAKIKVSEVINELPCGYFVYDSDGELMAELSEDSEDAISEYWDSIGFNADGYGDALNNFETKLELLFNINNPHRVLGVWLTKITDNYLEDEIEGDNFNGASILANILSFASEHGVAPKMLAWLQSKQGKEFLLSRDGYSPASQKLLDEIARINKQNEFAAPSKVRLEKYISEKYKELGAKINLNIQ